MSISLTEWLRMTPYAQVYARTAVGEALSSMDEKELNRVLKSSEPFTVAVLAALLTQFMKRDPSSNQPCQILLQHIAAEIQTLHSSMTSSKSLHLTLYQFFRLCKHSDTSADALQQASIHLLSVPEIIDNLPPWVLYKWLSSLHRSELTTLLDQTLEASLRYLRAACAPFKRADACDGCCFLAHEQVFLDDTARSRLALARRCICYTIAGCAADESKKRWSTFQDIHNHHCCDTCFPWALLKLIASDDDSLYSSIAILMSLPESDLAHLNVTARTLFKTTLNFMKATPSSLVEATVDDGGEFLTFMLTGLRAWQTNPAQKGEDDIAELLNEYCIKLEAYAHKGLIEFNVTPLVKRLKRICKDEHDDSS
eukprot:TRINITY_DN7079_c0_g1_i1.p1 TRINITY_DN7079_c0_g1~~TRINITY_DN7079_c0_g1_i1.p1  ORF type:complete len:407 (+),score=42.89 TRINITY_DN7079_c0_g1_i1:119-1222(+)